MNIWDKIKGMFRRSEDRKDIDNLSLDSGIDMNMFAGGKHSFQETPPVQEAHEEVKQLSDGKITTRDIISLINLEVKVDDLLKKLPEEIGDDERSAVKASLDSIRHDALVSQPLPPVPDIKAENPYSDVYDIISGKKTNPADGVYNVLDRRSARDTPVYATLNDLQPSSQTQQKEEPIYASLQSSTPPSNGQGSLTEQIQSYNLLNKTGRLSALAGDLGPKTDPHGNQMRTWTYAPPSTILHQPYAQQMQQKSQGPEM